MRNGTIKPLQRRRASLDQPMTRLTTDAKVPGSIDWQRADAHRRASTTDNNADDVPVHPQGREDVAGRPRKMFEARRTQVHARARSSSRTRDRAKLEARRSRSWGCRRRRWQSAPTVKTHDLDIPRIGYVHAGRGRRTRAGSRAGARHLPTCPTRISRRSKLRDGNPRVERRRDHLSARRRHRAVAGERSCRRPARRRCPTRRRAEIRRASARSDESRRHPRRHGAARDWTSLVKFVQEGGTLIVGGIDGVAAAVGRPAGRRDGGDAGEPARAARLKALLADKKSPITHGRSGRAAGTSIRRRCWRSAAAGLVDLAAGAAAIRRRDRSGVGMNITPNAVPETLTSLIRRTRRVRRSVRRTRPRSPRAGAPGRHPAGRCASARIALPGESERHALSGSSSAARPSNRACRRRRAAGQRHVVMFATPLLALADPGPVLPRVQHDPELERLLDAPASPPRRKPRPRRAAVASTQPPARTDAHFASPSLLLSGTRARRATPQGAAPFLSIFAEAIATPGDPAVAPRVPEPSRASAAARHQPSASHPARARENPAKGLSRSALGAFVQILACQQGGHLLGHGQRDKLIQRDILPFGQLARLGVQRIRQPQTEDAHDVLLTVFENSPGVITRTPNRSAPTKSRTLCVTMASQFASTANSRMNSSPGSQRRPPEKEHLSPAADVTQIVHHRVDVPVTQPQGFRVNFEHGLVFENERDRNNRLEQALPKLRQNLKRRALPRPESGDEHVGVQHDAHALMVSHTIPPLPLTAGRHKRTRCPATGSIGFQDLRLS